MIGSIGDYRYTGSHVNGPFYAYAIVQHTQTGVYAVLLCWSGLSRIVVCGSYSDAREQGERFADIGRAYFRFLEWSKAA